MDFLTVLNFTPVATAVFLFFYALALKTQNLSSAIFFKVIPFTFAVFNLYIGGKLNGWI